MTKTVRPSFTTMVHEMECGCQPLCCLCCCPPPPCGRCAPPSCACCQPCCCVPCPPPCGCGPVTVVSFPIRDVSAAFRLSGTQLAPGCRVSNEFLSGQNPVGVQRLSATQILLESCGAPYSVTYELNVDTGTSTGSARVVPTLTGRPVEASGSFEISADDAPAILEFVVEGSCACSVAGNLVVSGR